jgi:Transposase DDE domain
MIMKELELIGLYFYLCECKNNLLLAYCQRFSPNASPNNEKLTDCELLTIYLYCRRYEGKQSKKEIYDYAQRYLKSWFPDLPAFANFNSRLNNLAPALPYLVEQMLQEVQNIESQDIEKEVSLIDSLPIMLCSGKRRGKVAPELSEKSYCSTKGIYYFGLKLHVLAFRRKGKLPVPEMLVVTSAAENDLEAFRSLMPDPSNRSIFGDKAYSDLELQENLLKNANTSILTPVKLVKGETLMTRQFKKAADDLFSTAVSSIRQPIESLFNWLIEKTNIQNASKVRCTKGLILHIFGAIAAALTFWLF